MVRLEYKSGSVLKLDVNPGTRTPTTLALVSSLNPSTFGQSVTFTATISGAGGTPNGAVIFKDNGSDIAGCSTQSLSGGQAACTTSSLSLGVYIITGVFSGNISFSGSTGTLSTNQIVNSSALCVYLPLIQR